MTTQRTARSGRLALLCATLIWGSSFIILKSVLDSIPALWILAIRFLGAAAMMALLGIRRLRRLDRTHLYYGAALGTVMAVAYVLQTYGLQFTTPGKNAFLTSTYCVMVPFLCWIVYKKRPDGYNIAAAVICVAGMALVSLTGDLSLGIGDGLTMLCGVFYAVQIMIISVAVTTCDVVLLSLVQFGAAGVLCLAAAPFVAPFPLHAPAAAWLAVAYMCLLCTGVCFLLQGYGQKYTPPQTAAILLTLESVFGTVLSMIFYHERLSLRVAAGFALIFVSVVISETKLGFLRKKKPAE